MNVAQSCTLLYRRIAFCEGSNPWNASKMLNGRPSATRRYSRVKLCATSWVGHWPHPSSFERPGSSRLPNTLPIFPSTELAIVGSRLFSRVRPDHPIV